MTLPFRSDTEIQTAIPVVAEHLARGRLLLQEGHEVGVARVEREGTGAQDLVQLLPRPDEGRALEAELVLQGHLQGRFERCPCPGRVEHDVAAVDEGPHIGVPEALADRDEAAHGHASTPEVHRAQEPDPDAHAGQL